MTPVPHQSTSRHTTDHPDTGVATTAHVPDLALLLQGLQHAPAGIVVVDTRLRVAFYNTVAETLWGVPRAKVIGQPVEVLLRGGECDDILADLRNCAGGSVRPCYLVRRQTGESRHTLAVSISAVAHPRRNLYIAFVRDVTASLEQQAHVQRLSLALDRSDNAILLCDRQGHLQYVNDGFTRMLGYLPDEALQRRLRELVGGRHSDPETLEFLTTHHLAGVPHQTDLLAYRKDGSPLWTSVVATPIADEHGDPSSFINVLTDITAAKTNEVLHNRVLEALVREESLHESMALICQEVERVAPDVVVSIYRLDAEGRLRLLAAPSLPRIFTERFDGQLPGPGTAACGAVAWRGRAVEVVDIATDPLFSAHREPALSQQLRACWSIPVKSSTGQVLGTFTFYFRQPMAPGPWHRKLAELCLHLCSLAMEREKTKARMHQLAFYDALTGLPNRIMFHARAEQIFATAYARKTSLAVLYLDLDRFKRINETQGHAAGDGLLRDIAQCLAETAGSEALIGRLNGDEFVLLLAGDGTAQVAVLCERLLGAIARPRVVGHMTVYSSASIGVAIYPDDGRDIETLLKHADLAMYRAKDEGSGSFRFFSADMNRVAQERVALETALRESLRRGDLQLHYQPQVCSSTHELYGVEALVRWEHPHLGPVSPAQFIPLAEECGLIDDLSRWVLQQACTDLARWRQQGMPVPRVSVNLSARNLDNIALPLQLEDLLHSHALPADALVVEITEGVMLSPLPQTLFNLEAIRALGIPLSLDDFGTGYSSLSNLHRLPISELKLDMSFVREIEHSEAARMLITSVLRIGEHLGKRVVAEGVETEQQCRFLTEQRCDILQGYLFSRPLPAAALEQWLLDHNRALRA
ncbi:EAL domain-containing protein [Stenotrophomonas sp. YIM B06876]|uniref:sensor domain-containing protein n=1 Tax=Stenotrophomonas sp. YIM B06876 TaxID=3060211 RepID=UPI00273A44ED|nr:EAL domain-containing protein [Stenotrophomonas sp. YIM B06876]